ncbi:solute carrier family 28 member 3-like isoform X2 [Photinus pyralis]|uniref:solute carrier family 28 member 3-like isoform X2 n=1 Tax=Photinus pyralis TaxID=7054 RepID=UPI0012672B87|nr:solute carrier family 28 member 3-like isoform X2 [Photinus pyralis]
MQGDNVEEFPKKSEEKSRRFPGGLPRLLQNVQDATSEMLRRNKKTLKACTYVILNVALVGYFAWATYYFVEFSNDTLASTTCTGYGFLMIIFVLVYFGVAYSLIIKPVIKRIDTGRISNFFSNRTARITTHVAIAVAIGVYLAIDTSDNRQRLVPLSGLFVFLLFGFLFSKHPEHALSTIFFLGFMINILYHYGIMQKIVVSLGELLQAVMGTTICESVNSVANIFLGMNDSPLLLKPYLEELTVSEIHAVMTSGFASVAGSLLAGYISFGAEASHLITASVMSAPAALCYSKLIYPETEEVTATKETIQLLKSEYASALDAACNGAAIAIEIVLRVAAILIAFISAIHFLNGVLSWMGILIGFDGGSTWTLETAVGYVFMPVSFIMGVPWDECQLVGRLIGIKTMVNEFSAFKEMGQMILRKRTKMIATYAICGFSNPGSIGITISALSVLIPKKRSTITSTVFSAFVAGEITCFMSACIAALLIPDHLL